MGTPLLPNDIGEDCEICWGPDKIFGDGPTPKFIWLEFSDYTVGPGWNVGCDIAAAIPHLLQQGEWPCIFSLSAGNYFFRWRWLETSTNVIIQQIDPARTLISMSVNEIGAVTIVDDTPSNPADAYLFGTAKIHWSSSGL